MAKEIKLTVGKDSYTLKYTRDSVKTMERQGFVADEIDTKPMTVIPALFRGAFIAEHPNMKRSKIDEIYDSMGNKRKLIEALSEMYSETIETLLEDGDKSGNVEWATNWKAED